MDTYLQLIDQTPKKVIIIYYHLMLPQSTVVSTIYDSYPHMKYESSVKNLFQGSALEFMCILAWRWPWVPQRRSASVDNFKVFANNSNQWFRQGVYSLQSKLPGFA